MDRALAGGPYQARDNASFLVQMIEITSHHIQGCAEYRRICQGWERCDSVESLPFLHVGLFKRLLLRTQGQKIEHGRMLHSSSTSGSGASQIVLDKTSSALQQASVRTIFRDFLGDVNAPLVLLDCVESLRQSGISARIAAGLSLQSFSTSTHFILKSGTDDVLWPLVDAVLGSVDDLLVYGFTWVLWKAWAQAAIPEHTRSSLVTKRIHFVHSGGWKKLESERITRDEFDSQLLRNAGPGSRVIDFYGLVEQVGIVYPHCPYGFLHVPVWAEILVRDPLTHEVLADSAGQLQLMNTLAWGAPYHNVLTEDLAKIIPGECPCGRLGKRFVILGRMPKVELRGCANV